MFRNRLASDLRSHFSPVGPSPATSGLELRASSEAPSSTPRLHLLSPRSAPFPSPSRNRILTEFVRVSSHRISAFLAEAAVLVLVLGILDRFLASNHLDLRWVGGAFAVSLTLLASSIVLELTARLWLPHS